MMNKEDMFNEMLKKSIEQSDFPYSENHWNSALGMLQARDYQLRRLKLKKVIVSVSAAVTVLSAIWAGNYFFNQPNTAINHNSTQNLSLNNTVDVNNKTVETKINQNNHSTTPTQKSSQNQLNNQVKFDEKTQTNYTDNNQINSSNYLQNTTGNKGNYQNNNLIPNQNKSSDSYHKNLINKGKKFSNSFNKYDKNNTDLLLASTQKDEILLPLHLINIEEEKIKGLITDPLSSADLYKGELPEPEMTWLPIENKTTLFVMAGPVLNPGMNPNLNIKSQKENISVGIYAGLNIQKVWRKNTYLSFVPGLYTMGGLNTEQTISSNNSAGNLTSTVNYGKLLIAELPFYVGYNNGNRHFISFGIMPSVILSNTSTITDATNQERKVNGNTEAFNRLNMAAGIDYSFRIYESFNVFTGFQYGLTDMIKINTSRDLNRQFRLGIKYKLPKQKQNLF